MDLQGGVPMQSAPENGNKKKIAVTRFASGRLRQSGYLLSKIVLDYLLIIPTLLLLSPLLLLLSVLTRLDSPGPIFVRRPALGRNGREFTAYYFRVTAVTPQTNQPRLTRMGNLLHRYSLDELPLLFNVLRRDMSLIGPRLVSPDEVGGNGRYRPIISQAYPGLTGLWQISSGRNNRQQKELNYVQHWSIWLDIKILLLTVPAALKAP
jgi:lipopolysaccharide/colanic/teichoic acid biosynthesis glycosyltransferase